MDSLQEYVDILGISSELGSMKIIMNGDLMAVRKITQSIHRQQDEDFQQVGFLRLGFLSLPIVTVRGKINTAVRFGKGASRQSGPLQYAPRSASCTYREIQISFAREPGYGIAVHTAWRLKHLRSHFQALHGRRSL